ncbi:Protein hob1 [Neolecta irregularis DAH-3]|uniref:Protein hob1 n=1 Tax=Neolecta irregularis (strain DAH-3) TaxID=1198029 RepID=A0A1U7LKX5_NEOID|nr:Protein hob1 [Neolecta irregularis DAH-3]|eukprot:OLL23192.1 Protein hob1 [Neolecta irregularis DAH-3]
MQRIHIPGDKDCCSGRSSTDSSETSDTAVEQQNAMENIQKGQPKGTNFKLWDTKFTTTDYGDLKRRFDFLESQIILLHGDCMEFVDTLEDLFTTQQAYTDTMTELYRPMINSSSNSAIFESERCFYGDKMCRQFQSFTTDLRQAIQPELNLIESKIIQPVERVLDMVFDVRKVMIERDQRALEQAKLRTTLQRMKSEPTGIQYEKETENLLKSLASEFECYDNILKADLPRFFRLQRALVDPLFQTLYYLQLYIYYTLSQNMAACRISRLDLEADILKTHHFQQGDAQARLDRLPLTRTRTRMGLLNRSASFIRPRNSSKERESIVSGTKSMKSMGSMRSIKLLNPLRRVKSYRKSARIGKPLVGSNVG